MNLLRLIAFIPVIVTVSFLYGYWLMLGITICNSFVDWLFYDIVTILGCMLLVKGILVIYKKLFENSPTPLGVFEETPSSPPRTPSQKENVLGLVTYSNKEIASIVREWFDIEGIEKLKRNTFTNGFTDIFRFLQSRIGFVPQGSNQLIKMNNLIELICETGSFYLNNDYLTIIREAEPRETRSLYNRELQRTV